MLAQEGISKDVNCMNWEKHNSVRSTVCPKKYANGFCFAVLCCGYTLTDFPISIRLTSLALWQSNDLDKYFMWINYERLHNHNKAKYNKTVCIFIGIYCKANATRCGVTKQILSIPLLLFFEGKPSMSCLLYVTFIFEKCRRISFVVEHMKYWCVSKDTTRAIYKNASGNFAMEHSLPWMQI